MDASSGGSRTDISCGGCGAQIALATKHNMSSLVDSYRCLPWGPPTNIGGDAQGSQPGWYTNKQVRSRGNVLAPFAANDLTRLQINHKITLPEVQWLAPELEKLPGATRPRARPPFC